MAFNRDSVRSARLPALIASVAAILAFAAAPVEAATPPFETAFIHYPTTAFVGSQAEAGFTRVATSGATVIKLHLDWAVLAGPVRPLDPSDPNDPAYNNMEPGAINNWTEFDQLIRDTVAHGLKPLVMIARAPDWASDGPDGWTKPDAAELGLFAHAAAVRYNGDFPDPDPNHAGETLPAVRHWQVWNEPNQYRFLYPQRVGNQPVGVTRYRDMVNAMATGLKSVSASNLVLAGGTSPFKRTLNTAPLDFLRILVCLDTKLKPKKGCGPVRFDIWGTHPYTSGGPTRKAVQPGDVSLGDLPAVRKVLTAGTKAKKITAAGNKVKFWVDEFSWDTSPPDPAAIPAALHTRWVAEGMYRMWSAGVTLVAWLQLADNQYTGACGDPYQSGFYYFNADIAAAKVKPSIVAFRFPFVAIKEKRSIRIWGRTMNSQPGKVTIQRKTSGGWRRISTLKATSRGIFQARFGTPYTKGYMRAIFQGKASPSFALKAPSDRTFNPFGQRPPAGGCS